MTSDDDSTRHLLQAKAPRVITAERGAKAAQDSEVAEKLGGASDLENSGKSAEKGFAGAAPDLQHSCALSQDTAWKLGAGHDWKRSER